MRQISCGCLWLLLSSGVLVAQGTTKNNNDEFLAAAERGDQATVSALLAKGANINETESSGQTALMLASSSGHKEVVQVLLSNSADVNLATTQRVERVSLSSNFTGSGEIYNAGSTALIFACRHGHKDIVQMLLDKGANINAQTTSGTTALMTAAAYGQKEVIQLLLLSKADVNISIDGVTALSIASRNGYQEIVVLLKQAGAR